MFINGFGGLEGLGGGMKVCSSNVIYILLKKQLKLRCYWM